MPFFPSFFHSYVLACRRHIGASWIEDVFYCAASMTMVLALYTVCVASFATVYGHRLALQGPTGSVERAVAVMMKQRNTIFVTFGLSMFFLVVAACAMAWIKMNHYAAGGVSGVFLFFLIALLRKHSDLKKLYAIPREAMVQGDVRLVSGTTAVDVSRLEAGFGGGPFPGYAPPKGKGTSERSVPLCRGPSSEIASVSSHGVCSSSSPA